MTKMLYYKRRLKFCLYIPLEIQLEIIKRIPDVKSLLRLRSVSKQWKSFIDSSDFIASYGSRHTQPHCIHLFYEDAVDPSETKYTCFVDYDNDTFTEEQDCSSTLSMIAKQHRHLRVIGCSRGLLCLHGRISHGERKVILWNPCIRKSVVIVVPLFALNYIESDYGFGVCPVTNDPTIVKMLHPGPPMQYRRTANKPWHVEVFTLSSGVWNALPCSNMPRGSFKRKSSQVVIDRFIYWVVSKVIFMDDDCRINYMIMSFDLFSKEFRVVDISDNVMFRDPWFFISKLMESLVLFVQGKEVCDVRKMEPDGSFTKLFIINACDILIRNILGFKKNGELVMQTEKEFEIGNEDGSALEVYESCSKRIKDLGIYGREGSFFMSSCKETLLLLDHSNSYVYPVINDD